ncbi:MAG: hypothetical protein ACXVPK_09350 [Tumebacillaceae bacterium]
MNTRMDDYERDMLVKHVNFTLEKVRIVAEYNKLVRHVNEKLWVLPFQAHLFLAAVVAAGLRWLTGWNEGDHPVKQNATMFFLGCIVYMVCVFIFNRMVILIKKAANDSKLRTLKQQRIQAMTELRKYSEIPEDYWHASYMEYAKRSLDNGLVDTKGELINILEDEIAYRNEMNRLKRIEQADRRAHSREGTGVHF